MWDLKRKLAMVAVPSVLALGATAVVAHAAQPGVGAPVTNTQTATQDATPEAADTSAEGPETATAAPKTAAELAAEANEPAIAGGGHSDAPGQVDHQFEGNE